MTPCARPWHALADALVLQAVRDALAEQARARRPATRQPTKRRRKAPARRFEETVYPGLQWLTGAEAAADRELYELGLGLHAGALAEAGAQLGGGGRKPQRGGHSIAQGNALGNGEKTDVLLTWNPSDEASWPERFASEVCVTADLFAPASPLDVAQLQRLWDLMWAHPESEFFIVTRHLATMTAWIDAHAARREHGWTPLTQRPFACGGYTHFEDILMRNACGYSQPPDNEPLPGGEEEYPRYACWHPGHEERGGEDSCDRCECPLADVANHRDELSEIGVADEYEYDEEGFTHDCCCQWMRWHTRPCRALAGNVWLGYRAQTAIEYRRALNLLRELRNSVGPHGRIFLVLGTAACDELKSLAALEKRHLYMESRRPFGVPVCNRIYGDSYGEHGLAYTAVRRGLEWYETPWAASERAL